MNNNNKKKKRGEAKQRKNWKKWNSLRLMFSQFSIVEAQTLLLYVIYIGLRIHVIVPFTV
jgi:hypothetical protein